MELPMVFIAEALAQWADGLIPSPEDLLPADRSLMDTMMACFARMMRMSSGVGPVERPSLPDSRETG